MTDGARGRAGTGVREGQGRDWVVVLARDAQDGPAGHQHGEARAGGEEAGDLDSGLKHLLEVVKHQQQVPGVQVRREAVAERLGAGVL